MVGVVVREEDLLELHEAHVATQELPLRPLGAVEEQAITAPPYEGRAERALRGRHRARRPQENDVQLHGLSLDRHSKTTLCEPIHGSCGACGPTARPGCCVP